MTKSNSLLLALIVLAATSATSRADTIYQTNPQGKQVIVHRDAILVKEDSASIIYKHFELKERRVVKVRLSKGSLPYRVATTSPEDRQRIVGIWKRFGFTATVTDQAGKATQVFDAYLDFYPPGGRGSLLESVPPRTTFPVMIEGGGADELDFSKIARIEFQGALMKITMRDGKTLDARFLMPTDRPAETRLMGITAQYNPASEDVFDFAVPLDRLKEIQFE
ncbi:MAG: hypothetical protein ACE145_12065 [Terriglobia bacterium]